MSEPQGKFVWYELMTSDSKAAESFYRSVIGWDSKDAGMPGMSYTLLSAGPTMIAGLMTLPDEARAQGARPGWMGYVGVSDVDACQAQVTAKGGAVHHAATDIPGVGRFAAVADPQGAAFALFHGTGEPPPNQAAPDEPGHIGWHELHASDADKAFDFYAGLFNWAKSRSMDMGSMGTYQMFATGGETIGAVMKKVPERPAPFWLYYFNVASMDTSMERVEQGGGKILFGPEQVPTGSWVAQCLDPQGAMFAMVGAKR
ncbi:MAG: VOC family protein [Burkholderiaceae bacterium]|nr:MAG: VOC family protein [Burkholderiaceae bacterium]TAL99891.1 MAG: VOC family protein [Pusillimonas sp.]